MMHSERLALLTRWLAKLGSDLLLLLMTQELWSEFSMIGKVISFQVRDQEDEEQREARLATDRDHHALVRFVYCLQPSSGQNMSAVVNDIALPEKQSLSFAQPHASRLR